MSNIYSVKQVNAYIKNMFTQDFLLRNLCVSGEVSNCKYHTSGHIYFSLKDESGAIACVMFAGQRKGLAFSMKDGDKVVVEGSVDVYQRDGRYQLYARKITLEGAGLLYERFLALKAELEEMGMFDAGYKQPIPRFIRTLGVVTAPTGAAVQDIRNIAYRRNPYVQVILYPALVQGDGAKESIVKGIQALEALGVDVMIVGRGGGSIEDLWAFNEEEVARAVFNCSVPVISAVGHETDTTIIDYVADLRAPTPSAAAELAVYDYRALQESLLGYEQILRDKMGNRLELMWERIKRYQMRLRYLSPQSQIREKRQYLVDTQERLRLGMRRQTEQARNSLDLYIERLKGLSPLDKLKQGFSYGMDKDGRTLVSIAQVKRGDMVTLQVSDGAVHAQVAEVDLVDWGQISG
ncbi:MAG: exodeoxyribonuclease VII large subunit [Lachnospiraceae bacterium]|nr:exodeoxyribonuclease VII large subunit [Lachnospiraceae bacterium]MCI9389392.1 exodeoxyribonuclease VII large subunit [Lachnospiraceae bacterium]